MPEETKEADNRKKKRKEERKRGRKEERKEGRKEGKKEGRKDGNEKTERKTRKKRRAKEGAGEERRAVSRVPRRVHRTKEGEKNVKGETDSALAVSRSLLSTGREWRFVDADRGNRQGSHVAHRHRAKATNEGTNVCVQTEKERHVE